MTIGPLSLRNNDKSKYNTGNDFRDLLEYHVITYQNNETISLQKSAVNPLYD